MKRSILFVIIAFMSYCSNAQMTDNRLTVYLGSGFGVFSGEKTHVDSSFIYPSLFPNYEGYYGLSAKGIFKCNHFISMGISIDQNQASNWTHTSYTHYSASRLQLLSLSPIFQFHTKTMSTGVFNRLKFTIGLEPVVGFATIYLKNPIFDIQPENEGMDDLLRSRDLFYGIKGSAGANYSISQNLGFFLNYTYRYQIVSSLLYNEKQFLGNELNFGLFFRFMKDKHLYI